MRETILNRRLTVKNLKYPSHAELPLLIEQEQGDPIQVSGNCDVGGGMTTIWLCLWERFSVRLSILVSVTFKFSEGPGVS